MTYLISGDVSDLAPAVIDGTGLPRVMQASFYEATTQEERTVLAVRHGLYGLPTVELVAWLRTHIGDRSAIEIGAGNGRLAEAVGIPATDTRIQEGGATRAHYESIGQAPVTYGPNVERIEALDAVRKHRPSVVVGSWITHRYDGARHAAGGSMYGPDTLAILALCDEYVHIGNEGVHQHDPLWALPHEVHHFPWLYSRAMNGGRDVIGVWKGNGAG
jgi:hypothetical protein